MPYYSVVDALTFDLVFVSSDTPKPRPKRQLAEREAIPHTVGAIDYALRYVRAGYRVFPTRGKIPLTAHGAHSSTYDDVQVRKWWQRFPNAGIGLSLSGLVAIDIDPRNGGDVSLLPPLPDTVRAQTGGGGSHYLYRARNIEYAGKLAPGVDLKSGAGVYICVEPTVHISGRKYQWLVSPFDTIPALAPEWLHGR